MRKLAFISLVLLVACRENASIKPTVTSDWEKAIEISTIDQIHAVASNADHLYLLTTSLEGNGRTFFNIDKDNNIVEKRPAPFFNANGYFTLTEDFYAIADFSASTAASLISFYSLEQGKTGPVSVVDANEFMPDVNNNLSPGADVSFSPIGNSDGSYWMLLVRTNHATGKQDMGVARFVVGSEAVSITMKANINSQDGPDPRGLYTYKDNLLFTSRNSLIIVSPDGTFKEMESPGGSATVDYVTVDNTLFASYSDGDRFYTTDLVNWTRVEVDYGDTAVASSIEGPPVLVSDRFVTAAGKSLNIYDAHLVAGSMKLLTVKDGPDDVTNISNTFKFNNKLYLFTKPAFYTKQESDLFKE